MHIKRHTNETNLSVFNQRSPTSPARRSSGSAGVSRGAQFRSRRGSDPGCRNLSPLSHLCEPRFPHTGQEVIEAHVAAVWEGWNMFKATWQCWSQALKGSDCYYLHLQVGKLRPRKGKWPGCQVTVRVWILALRFSLGVSPRGGWLSTLPLHLNHFWSFFLKIKAICTTTSRLESSTGALITKSSGFLLHLHSKGRGAPCSGPARKSRSVGCGK